MHPRRSWNVDNTLSVGFNPLAFGHQTVFRRPASLLSSATVVDGVLYVGSTDGYLYATGRASRPN
jgi:hypothetical protein